MRNRLLFLALVLPNLAFGQSWADFDAVNPPFPCQDGWMGCIQEDANVRPELQKDSEGMPRTADLRLGWFDLAPTSNFSPFSTLSAYPEGPVPRISAEPEPGPVAAADPDAATGTDGTAGADDPAAGEDPTNDGTADVAFMDPEAERARMEAQQRKLEEAEMRRAQQRAAEEADRARREEERRKREADDRARAAQKAMAAVNKAASDADRKRLEAEAKEAAEAQKRAAAAALEAEQMRQERERQEAAKRKAAEEAAEQSRQAEAERKRREAEEKRKADAEREAAEARRKQAEAEAAKAAEAARAAAEAAEKARKAEAEKAAKAAADRAAAAKDAEERARLEKEQRELAAKQKAEAEAAKQRAAEAAAKAKADAQAKAEAEEKQRQAERMAAQAAEKKRIQEEQAAKLAAEKGKVPDEAAEGSGECSDLVQLETKAVLGKLGAPTVKCLEDRLAASTRQTEKSKVSRLLMGNAFATNKSEWERLMKRHLEEIDQSDPDLCYKYAIQLVKKGPGSMFQVIKWADVALENRAVWTGSTYQKRVYSLYKVRTVAANKIWMNYEDKHAANPTDDTNEKLKDARNRTKVYAREWYEYAKAADKDTTEALNTCQSAAGTKKYCEAG